MRSHSPSRGGCSRWRRLIDHVRLAVGAGGGPLCRPVDRARSRALVGVWLVMVLASVGAVAAAVLVFRSSQAGAVRAAARLHQVSAVVRSTPQQADFSASGASAGGYRATATWTFPPGHTVTDQAPVPSTAVPGSTVPVWVDGTGQPATAPRSTADMVATAGFIALGGWSAAALTCSVVYGVRRSRLEHRAEDAWQADWELVEPGWTGRAGGRPGAGD
ncbi:hypothetical protein [Kitasatospora sp. NPDC059571]|uniref:Rv1733c family protein n=1 Tax=Kitasatospora sp. NPDC059571 TaxID=3346871 RepID=UPI0036AE17BE